MKKTILLSGFIFFILTTRATIRNVPSQYNSIQLALNACLTNDTVLVDQGVYFENIVWPTVHGLKLLSVAGSSGTIINGGSNAKCIKIFTTVNDTGIVLKGFTFTNGSDRTTNGAVGGAGIRLNYGSVLLEDLIVTDNHIGTPNWADGAGILGEYSNVTMINVTVFRNVIDSGSWCYGAGAQFHDGIINITNCTFSNNESHSDSWCYGTGLYLSHCIVQINETKIENNLGFDGASWYYGMGMYAEETSGTLSNILFADNNASVTGSFHYGAGIYLRSTAAQPPVIHANNLTVANNSSGGTNANSVYNTGDSLIITNSVIWSSAAGTEVNSATAAQTIIKYSDVEGGYAGTGNINSDPLFVSSSDYHLQLTSPCIAVANLGSSPLIDLENNPRPMPSWANPDMGCYEMDEGGNVVTELMTDNFSFTVYPNPASNRLSIDNRQSAINTIEIYNVFGENVVFQSGIANRQSEILIDVSNLTSGIYLIKISSGENNFYKRVVIER